MRIALTLLGCLSALFCKAQFLTCAGGAERSVNGSAYGVFMGYENKSKWGGGAFYQAQPYTSAASEEIQWKNQFYGAFLQAPLVSSAKILFALNLRAGFINKDFFVFVPSLETTVHLHPRVGAVFGMGYRYGYPAASIKLITKVF